MSAKHTPGPWEVINGYYPSLQEISGPSFKISCVMWATDLTEGDYQKRDADLRLIAAAPDLLEALQRILKAANLAENMNALDWIADTASEAINKAIGGNHD